MTDSNLVQMAAIEEITWGTTSGSPTTRLVRYTGESISYDITTIQSAEIISDRQVTDLVQTAARATGDLNWELSYAEHDEYRGGNLFNTWANTPFKDNAGVSDSVITDVGTTANTWVVVSGGGSFVTGHLAKSSGNTNAANNIVFRVTTSTATTVVGSGLSLVAETAPNAIARIKVVGFQGAAGDITATATGFGSTLLNFTTLGLSVGQWIKIGGTAAGDQFATAVLNDWARITVIAASALTLDNRPTGWTTDAGAAKTIKVWFGDRISNGATQRSWTIEKGFKGQVTPYYLPFTGMIPGEMKMTIRPGAHRLWVVHIHGQVGGHGNDNSADGISDSKLRWRCNKRCVQCRAHCRRRYNGHRTCIRARARHQHDK